MKKKNRALPLKNDFVYLANNTLTRKNRATNSTSPESAIAAAIKLKERPISSSRRGFRRRGD